MGFSTGYIQNGQYIRADKVENSLKQHREHPTHRESVRVTMRRNYSRDLVQRWTTDGKLNPEFIRAFPDTAAQQHTEEEIKEALTRERNNNG